MSTIYIDFDNTLYNSKQQLKDYVNTISNRFNLDQEFIYKEYQSFSKSSYDNDNLYSPERLLNKLKIKEFNYKCNHEEYLFDDSIPFLQSTNIKKVILSYGEYEWQMEKIKQSKIINYVDQVIICLDKYEEIKKTNYKNSFFIDDREVYFDQISQLGVKCVLINRYNTDCKTNYINSLFEFNYL